ncbi:hypothetical protein QSV08_06765 [Maribacter sp. BPC-D8]|uniref:hypothetical protein n=1 Tax=Maribacter sp. BPC-D8 TaxID=3053613 RepID=UPI002B45E39C|nr:hypothetical protein [Maribacter sp. BPC-D8]WRI30944.1 hypothetical protein QSV08_06765 [Maribacter sp. BPC-D8]
MHSVLHQKLKNGGFEIVKNRNLLEIPKKLVERYTNIPTEYFLFLKSFETITNSSDTAWFNSVQDFNEQSNNEYKWNEFEILSLEWSEDDDEELENVAEFWNRHIPILLSVKDGFQFLAISLTNENYGEIVHGQEPVFEEITKICNNFNELINLLENNKLQHLI